MTEHISPEKRKARKIMAFIALYAIVGLAIGVFFRPVDLGPNQTQVIIAIVVVLGGIVGFYNGVTGFESWTNNKHKNKNSGETD